MALRKIFKMNILYTSISNNQKTGNIPQQWIGATREESKQTCIGCPLLNGDNKLNCYAQSGAGARAHGVIISSYNKNHDKSLNYALQNRDKNAKYIRFGAIGDPSAIDPKQFINDYNECKKEGLGVLCYTHFATSKGKHLKGLSMASCDNEEQAEQLVKDGWRTTLILQSNTYNKKSKVYTNNGNRIIVCPAQTHDNITCNDCGLCDATKKAPNIIGFIPHGNSAKTYLKNISSYNRSLAHQN